MKKNKFSSYFVFLGILTFLTVFFLLIQKSYFSFKKPQELFQNEALLKEFNPNLDTEIISTIESKNSNADESFDFSILPSNKKGEILLTPTPSISPSPTLEATPSSAIQSASPPGGSAD